jgi:hypothetical protein
MPDSEVKAALNTANARRKSSADTLESEVKGNDSGWKHTRRLAAKMLGSATSQNVSATRKSKADEETKQARVIL